MHALYRVSRLALCSGYSFTLPIFLLVANHDMFTIRLLPCQSLLTLCDYIEGDQVGSQGTQQNPTSRQNRSF